MIRFRRHISKTFCLIVLGSLLNSCNIPLPFHSMNGKSLEFEELYLAIIIDDSHHDAFFDVDEKLLVVKENASLWRESPGVRVSKLEGSLLFKVDKVVFRILTSRKYCKLSRKNDEQVYFGNCKYIAQGAIK